MLPAVALVGRPNVGKSTLFNWLTRTRDALVADYPGLTRDRRYGFGKFEERSFLVIDTGGLAIEGGTPMSALVAEQVDIAVEEANAVVFVVDHKSGLTAEDERIAERLRRAGKPVVIAVNKTEGVADEIGEAEFHRLGLGSPIGIAALHGQGIHELLEQVLASFMAAGDDEEEARALEGPKVAVIGRPNVGKSTLINRLLGANRLITSEEPGTTRDSILVPCERDGRRFVLIDTAGIRRRARVSETVEKFSTVQSLQAIEDAGAVIALLDAREGVTDQDLHLIGLAVERGRALVIALNKWDGLPTAQRRQAEGQVQRKLDFAAFASVHYVSALHGSGIAELINAALAAYAAAGAELATPRLNKILRDAVSVNAPPMARGRSVRLRYAHQGGRYPPLIVIHGSQAERLPAPYRRYLENAFRQALKLKGTPVKVELRSGDNPFAGRRNVLTPRQAKRKRRVIRHSRRDR
ncbi:MAG TPA: ribosome biogenesis GTPase Der [Gammaproteobacteria bacterium]|nr:ribosome biogenesis GTPase Der [Gammaproteobacteria bacterium]